MPLADGHYCDRCRRFARSSAAWARSVLKPISEVAWRQRRWTREGLWGRILAALAIHYLALVQISMIRLLVRQLERPLSHKA